MEKEFVPYELALRLKKLGFDEGCFGYYYIGAEKSIGLSHQIEGKGFQVWTNSLLVLFDKNTTNISAPTFSQAFRWFREKYDMIAEFNWHFPSKCYATSIYPNDFYLQTKTYEEAELACLDKLIEIVESKQKEDE